MTEGEQTEDRERRRRAAAALKGARGRLTTACEKFATVEEWRAKVTQYLRPVLEEFGDVLPEGARGMLESAAEVTEPTRAGIAKSCRVLRGGLSSVAKELSAQTGLTGRMQETLRRVTRPAINLLPAAFRESVLVQALVATGLVVVGIGSLTAVAVIVAGGGGGGDAGSGNDPALFTTVTVPPLVVGDASQTPGAGDDLPDPCSLMTAAEAEALFGEPAVQEPSTYFCRYHPASRPADELCPRANLEIVDDMEEPGETVGGLGHRSYFASLALWVYEDDYLLRLTWTDAAGDGMCVAPLLEDGPAAEEEMIGVMETALSRLP